VPSSVIKQLDLKEGDKLRWQFETDKKGIYIKIEPVKKETSLEGGGLK
jgi:antitoxin component of MazEF toxin-antitoxin module